MTRHVSRLASAMASLAAVLASGLGPAAYAAQPSPNPAAIAVVDRYMRALSARDWQTAYGLLAGSQQRYFENRANFASNALATHYTILKYSLGRAIAHPDVVEVQVKQNVTLLDVGTGKTIPATVKEPVFAIRQQSGWGVKQLYQPWKAYAPNANGTNHGVEVVITRVEFFDKRIVVDCTIRNVGKVPVQILPMLKSTLTDGAGHTFAAFKEAVFPLNDVEFFKGPRIYPLHQSVGYITFVITEKKDETQSYSLAVGPAIEDGGAQTFSVPVGPFTLPKL